MKEEEIKKILNDPKNWRNHLYQLFLPQPEVILECCGKPESECRCEEADKRVYPCADCGKMISKNEGGTVFTLCEKCWDKHYKKELGK